MALNLAYVSVGAGLLTIQVPPDGSPASEYEAWGIKLSAGSTILITSGDGVAQTISLEVSEFDAEATPSNPITIQIQGFDCTLVVPASVTNRLQGPGYSGDGSVIVEAVSAFWTPADLVQGPVSATEWVFDSASIDTSSGFDVSPTTGSNTLSSNNDDPFSDPAGFARFSGNSLTIDNSIPATDSLFAWATVRINNTNNNQRLLAGNQNNDTPHVETRYNQIRVRDSSKNPAITFAAYRANWDGSETTLAPMPAAGFRQGALNFASDEQGEWILMLLDWSDKATNTNTVKVEMENADVRRLGYMSAIPTADELTRLAGFLVWDLSDIGLITETRRGELFDLGHIYESVAPTKAGGSSSSVAIQVPQTTITLNNLVENSRIYIKNITDNAVLFNEVESTTIFSDTIPSAKNLFIRIRNASASPKYKTFETTAFSSADIIITVNQEIDE